MWKGREQWVCSAWKRRLWGNLAAIFHYLKRGTSNVENGFLQEHGVRGQEGMDSN